MNLGVRVMNLVELQGSTRAEMKQEGERLFQVKKASSRGIN